METQTETNTTEAKPDGRRRYDHDLIREQLKEGKSVREICDAHGCSATIVQRIRRDLNGGGERTPRNVQRSVQLKKKCEQLDKDLELLNRWLVNEPNIEVEEGEPAFNDVTTLIETINEAKTNLLEAAALYEGLPEEAMKTTRGATKVKFEVGMVVRTKAKHTETYEGICSSPEHLTVCGERNDHLMVEDTEGSRFFVPAKELEPRKDA